MRHSKRQAPFGRTRSYLSLRYEAVMKLRARKALGTFLTVVWLTIYSLLMMAVGGILVIGRGIALELPFYIVAGLGWVPVEMWIIKFMSRPDPEAQD
jgi:hypothetical protein